MTAVAMVLCVRPDASLSRPARPLHGSSRHGSRYLASRLVRRILTLAARVLLRCWPRGRDHERGPERVASLVSHPTGRARLGAGRRPGEADAGSRALSRSPAFIRARRRDRLCERPGGCWNASVLLAEPLAASPAGC